MFPATADATTTAPPRSRKGDLALIVVHYVTIHGGGEGSWTTVTEVTPGRRADPGTTTGEHVHRPEDPGPRELLVRARRRSGLTWGELAECLHVSRRTIHFWASGRNPTLLHQERLRRLDRVIAALDRGLPSLTRRALLERVAGDRTGLDMLREGRFEEALELVGRAAGVPRPRPRALSPEARAARRPPRPADLVGEADGEPEGLTGTARVVRPRRAAEGESTDGRP